MSSQPPPIPFPINPIFNPLDWGYPDLTFLTIAIANTLYLQKAGDTATGLINFSAGLTATYASFSGLVTTNNTLTFRDATDDTGNITGVSGSLVLTALNDMIFFTNSGAEPLVLGGTTTTLQSDEIVIYGNDQITIEGGTIDIDSGSGGINILGRQIEIESRDVFIGVDTTTSITMGNIASTLALTGTTIDLTSSGQMTLASGSDMVLQALNNTNNAYIELDTTFIKTANTVEIDLTASGIIELTTASNMTLTASGDTTITGSTITLDAPQDEVLLATEPSGTVDLAVASVGYVNSGYIPIGQGMPVATVIMWAGDWANLPTGFMLCNGQSVSQATYSALYAVVGNYYGVAVAGNFLLPNLVNTFPIGSASGGATTYPYSTILGSALSNGGSSTISLNQIPSHAHGIIGNNTGTGGGSSVVINPNGTAGTATQLAGGGQAYAPPFQALQFLIKY